MLKNLIIVGDCRDTLATLPDGCVNTVVTSPPYYGLRDYGTAEWDGGDSDCDHRHQLGGEGPASSVQSGNKGSQTINYKTVCRKCGAVRIDKQIGLEATLEEYVDNMVEVFRGVWRVLRKDGTVWLNLGDSYAGSGRGLMGSGKHADNKDSKQGTNRGSTVGEFPRQRIGNLKPKDLMGVPWRVAFALQQDGWYLRSDIIWHKPNPMPSSVKDRPTTSHEYMFLLAKSRKYYYNGDAVREPAKDWGKRDRSKGKYTSDRNDSGQANHAGLTDGDFAKRGRNRRTVWTVTTSRYKGAHFATFPKALIDPCVKAGCPDGGTVMDIFGGAATTAVVANENRCNSILLELNADYADFSEKRIADEVGGLLATTEVIYHDQSN